MSYNTFQLRNWSFYYSFMYFVKVRCILHSFQMSTKEKMQLFPRLCRIHFLLRNLLQNWFFFRNLKISYFSFACCKIMTKTLCKLEANKMSPWTLKVKKNHSFACISLLSCQHSMFFTQIHPNTANTIILQNTSMDVFSVWKLSKFDVLTRNRLMYSGLWYLYPWAVS